MKFLEIRDGMKFLEIRDGTKLTCAAAKLARRAPIAAAALGGASHILEDLDRASLVKDGEPCRDLLAIAYAWE